jgi:two-component system catabolic regulation response regulator CreB
MAMGPTVLIVEDEPSIADTIEYAPRSEGFRGVLARTAGDALALARTDRPACVIPHIGLPDRSGADVCRELRSFTDIPVIFLSARDGEIDRVVGLELGADDYVVKPFSAPRIGRAGARRLATPATAGRN